MENSKRNRWLIFGAVLAAIGVGLSLYAIRHHVDLKAHGATDAVCNINETFSCDDVARSKYAEIFGIPMGVFGLGYFAALLFLLGSIAFSKKDTSEQNQAYVAMVALGFLTSVGLALISVFAIGAYCLNCMGVYTVCLLQAVGLVLFRTELPSEFEGKKIVNGLINCALVVALTVAGFNFIGPSPQPIPHPSQLTADNPDGIAPFAPTVQEISLSKSRYAGLGEDYRKGSDGAKVIIHEFADFQCPACRMLSSSLSLLAKEFGSRVLIVYRNFPLDQACNSSVQNKVHEFACATAVMARCAGQYGKFWEFHDVAFAGQSSIDKDSMMMWAKTIGLTDDQINNCKKAPELLEKVRDDVAIGLKLGIDSTPTLFVNGRKYVGGRSVEELRKNIGDLLNSL